MSCTFSNFPTQPRCMQEVLLYIPVLFNPDAAVDVPTHTLYNFFRSCCVKERRYASFLVSSASSHAHTLFYTSTTRSIPEASRKSQAHVQALLRVVVVLSCEGSMLPSLSTIIHSCPFPSTTLTLLLPLTLLHTGSLL